MLVFVLPLAVVLVSCLVHRLWVHSFKRRFSVTETCDGTEHKGSYKTVTTMTEDTAREDTKPAEDGETKV